MSEESGIGIGIEDIQLKKKRKVEGDCAGGKAKTTNQIKNDILREIEKKEKTQAEIARIYHITPSAVSQIKKNSEKYKKTLPFSDPSGFRISKSIDGLEIHEIPTGNSNENEETSTNIVTEDNKQDEESKEVNNVSIGLDHDLITNITIPVVTKKKDEKQSTITTTTNVIKAKKISKELKESTLDETQEN